MGIDGMKKMSENIVFEIIHSNILHPSWNGYVILKKFKGETTILMDNLTKNEMRDVYLNGVGMTEYTFFIFSDCIKDFNYEFPACGFCLDGSKKPKDRGYQLEKDGHCKHCNVIHDMKKWDKNHQS